jgi:hypothetical protein
MDKYQTSIANRVGRALSGASVSVFNSSTGLLATIYADNESTALANPLTTDDNGAFGFKAANGEYNLVITHSSLTTAMAVNAVILFDPTEYTPTSASGAFTVGGALTLNGSSITLGANNTMTRAIGTAAAGSQEGFIHATTFSGHSGGTSDVRSAVNITTLSGANSVAQTNVRSTQHELRHTAGTVTFAYGDQSFIRLGLAGSTTGNVTSARGYEFHFANESAAGVIDSALHFYAQDVDLLDGGGTINDIIGFKSGDFGHATRVTGIAVGHDAADMTAGATLTAAYRSQMASGTNKWGAYFSGSANNAFAGNVRIGSTTAPTVALDVTGAVKISSTLAVTGAATFTTNLTVTNGVYASGANPISFRPNGSEQFKIGNVASPANYVQVNAATTGNAAEVRAVGETNAPIHLFSSGTGSTYLGTNGGSAQVEVTHTASINRRLTLTGSNGGNPTISTTGGSVGIGTTVYFASDITADKTVTGAGTTGAQTINKNAGSVNFAAAASSLVVTDSRVTTSSIIIATVATNDSTMKSVAAVAGSGSFTLHANAAATAETRVNFLVVN